jgi:hypothetical protein
MLYSKAPKDPPRSMVLYHSNSEHFVESK